MEDDQNNSKWKMTKKNQNGSNKQKLKWKTTIKIENGRRPKN